MKRKFIILLFITIFLVSCISETTNIDTELTPTSTILPITLTATKTVTPTVEPTATPYGAGNELPRVAIFTELEPDDTAAGYIRIGTLDLSKGKIVFSETKLRVGTKPSLLRGYRDDPRRIRWSPNGDYLSYAWLEDKKITIYVYDFKNKKTKWELEFEPPRAMHFTLDWSADSNWLYIELGNNAYYILNITSGSVNNLINKRIQSVVWHATEPLLFFASFSSPEYYQYDPVSNQVTEIDVPKYNDQLNNGYLYENYSDRSFYLETLGKPALQLLQIGDNVNWEQLGVYGIIPSPDKSRYLIWGQTNLFLKENYQASFSTFVMKAEYPMVIENVDTTNGVYPLVWSPDGKSYIGYQYAWASDSGDRVRKIVIVDAETQSIIKDYDIYDGSKSNYGFFLTTWLGDYTGPLGIDIFWK